MKLEFLDTYKLGPLTMNPGDVLELNTNDSIQLLNDESYILIYKGLRYDIKTEAVKLLED